MILSAEAFDDPKGHQRLIDDAAASIRLAIGEVPEVLVVAGSGLGTLAGRVQNAKTIDYGELTNFPVSSVVGHSGKLVAGELAGKRVVVMSGRKHLYEGVDARQAVLPIRALVRAGVKVAILSNAAGSLNRFIEPGDLMLIDDHINGQFRNPLAGANLDAMGHRFPDMSEPYDRELMERARAAAREQKINLKEGTYLALLGPTYETRAEVEAFFTFADAVGMSTVPETIAAIHAGVRVLAISAITNSHVLRKATVTTHDEVMEMGAQVGEKFCALVETIVRDLDVS